MGQYWYTVNLDRKEFIDHYPLGCGAKLGEQIGGSPGVPDALFILLTAMPMRRGGGDFDLDSNFYGPERFTDVTRSTLAPGCNMGADVNEEYNEIAHRTIGRWVGDRVINIGDYSEDDDANTLRHRHGRPNLPKNLPKLSRIYSLCVPPRYLEKYPEDYKDIDKTKLFTDITADVAAVIEHECGGKFVGDGWKTWMQGEQLAKFESGKINQYGEKIPAQG